MLMKSDLGITSIALNGSTMGFILGPKLIVDIYTLNFYEHEDHFLFQIDVHCELLNTS